MLFFHAGFSGFRGGFSGVDIFFVISGFLIGGHIYSEELRGQFSIAGFCRRRAKRILPALYVVIVAVLLAGVLLLSPHELQRAATEGVATLFFGSNFFFWKVADYFAIASDQHVLLMTWSLGVEEQFYVVVPLFMVWLLRRKIHAVPIMASLTVLSFGLACFQAYYAPVAAFYLLPARAWELFGGVLLALILSSDRRKIRPSRTLTDILGLLGLIIILAPVLFLTASVPLPALPSVAGSALLLASSQAWTNRRILSFGPLRWIGRISYSLYLWHWPLFSFARIVLGAPPSHLQTAGILAASFLLATSSYYWVEQPFRNSATPQYRLLLRYAALTAALAVLCLAVRATWGLAFRTPVLAAQEMLASRSFDPCLVDAPISHPNPAPLCWENTGRPAVALWGDSHASSVARVVRQKAHAAGYDFIEIAKGSCPPLYGAGRYLTDAPGFAENCIAFNDDALHRIDSDSSIRIVLLAACWRDSLVDPWEKHTGWLVTAGKPAKPIPDLGTSRRLLLDRLGQSLQQLQRSGKRVLVFEDAPGFLVEPLWRTRTAALLMRRWIVGISLRDQSIDPGTDVEAQESADQMARAVVSSAATTTGAALVDLEGALCRGPDRCQYRDATRIFYEDQQHLSLAGGQFALRSFSLPPQPNHRPNE